MASPHSTALAADGGPPSISATPLRRKRLLRIATMATATALGIAGATLPAHAAEPRPDLPVGATVELASTTVAPGGEISFTGTGWTGANGNGAVVGAIKLDDVTALNTEPVKATAAGAISGKVTLPADVTAGAHWVRFLSGADQAGDPTRSIHAKFTVATPASVTLASSTVQAGKEVSVSAANFAANATITVKLDKTETLGTLTAGADGSVTNGKVTIPANTAAGDHTLYFLAPGVSIQAPVSVITEATPNPDPEPEPEGDGYTVGGTLAGAGGSYEVAVDEPLGKTFVAGPKDGATGSISVIDNAKRTIDTSWSLDAAPYGIAVNTKNHKLYTTDTRADTVSVYDGKTGKLLKTIDGFSGPHGVEVDSVHNLVYVTDPGEGHVVVIDGNTDTIKTTVNTGKTSVQIALDPAHDSYWVSNTGDHTVVQIDRKSNKIINTVETAEGPQNMVVNNATDELYVDNFRASSVQVINTNTATIAATIPVSASPIGISLDPTTNTYFVSHLAKDAATGNSKVSVIDGSKRTLAQELSTKGVALGIGTDSTSHTTYVTDRDSATISVITATGDTLANNNDNRKAGVVIKATVPDTGGLALSVASKSVTLSNAAPNSGLTALVSTGTLPTVTVADLRAANPGWTVTGKVTDFSSTSGSTVAGNRLGWTPSVLTTGANQTVTAGARVSAGSDAGGLVAGATLASAAAGAGAGTATLEAALTLSFPTDTKPGTYAGTLTLTVI